jgi:hypothetical protein
MSTWRLYVAAVIAWGFLAAAVQDQARWQADWLTMLVVGVPVGAAIWMLCLYLHEASLRRDDRRG